MKERIENFDTQFRQTDDHRTYDRWLQEEHEIMFVLRSTEDASKILKTYHNGQYFIDKLNLKK